MCDTNIENVKIKKCNQCSVEKVESEFNMKGKYRQGHCKVCNNEKRKELYKNNEILRKKCIIDATALKKKKKAIRDEQINAHQEEIGLDNMECRYCFKIKHKDRFRWNRKKCRDCERDDPKYKLQRTVRSRIYTALYKCKSKHTIEYLGMTSNDYLDWITTYNSCYNLDNRGTVWHIDHVIPLSKFDLNDPDEQLIAFNWRNTMPLSATENLKKNNRLITEQITEHLKKLEEYHTYKNIIMPEKFKSLYATHLVVLERP
ncbi:MAG: hypothetical protein CXT73_05575 [Methanobacteriota archaeon]|jgi:hypothetical protein|nr:MAG: hypothetical protein CXT73_05575 [Euryarchaeota archaeon]